MTWTKLTPVLVVGVAFLLAACHSTPLDYSWETDHPLVSTLTNARPQLTIRPTKFDAKTGWRTVVTPDGRCMGINMTPLQIIQSAYKALGGVRTKVGTPLPEDRYDFICNLPQGASNALHKAIRVKFGITAGYQMVETNVLILSVNHPYALGLIPDKKSGRQSYRPGHFFIPGQPIRTLAGQIDNYFGLPVIDKTKLTGKFIINLTWDPPPRGTPPPLEPFNQALIDQLGLELKPEIQPVKMLVVVKAK